MHPYFDALSLSLINLIRMLAFIATKNKPIKYEVMVDAIGASISVQFTELLVLNLQQELFEHSLSPQ